MSKVARMLGIGLMTVGLLSAAVMAEGKGTSYSIRLASQTQLAGYEEAVFGDSTLFVAANTAIGSVDIVGARATTSAIDLTLSANGATVAANLVRANAGQRLAVYEGQRIVAAPAIESGMLKGTTLTVSTAALTPMGTMLTVTSSKTTAQAGEMINVDVFVSQAQDLRGYQVAVEATGGKSGGLHLVDIHQDAARADWVFGGEQIVNAVDVNGSRMVAALFSGSTNVAMPKYLGTFSFQSTKDASGTFAVKVRASDETALRDSNSQPIGYHVGPAVLVNIGSAGTTSR